MLNGEFLFYKEKCRFFNYLTNKISHRKKKKKLCGTCRKHYSTIGSLKKQEYSVETLVVMLFVTCNVIHLTKLPMGYK